MEVNTVKATIEQWVRDVSYPPQGHSATMQHSFYIMLGFSHLGAALLREIVLALYLPTRRQIEFPPFATLEKRCTTVKESFKTGKEIKQLLQKWEGPLHRVKRCFVNLQNAEKDNLDESLSTLEVALEELPLIPTKSNWFQAQLPFPSDLVAAGGAHAQALNFFYIEPLLVLKRGLSELKTLEVLLNQLNFDESSPVSVKSIDSHEEQGRRDEMQDAHFHLEDERMCIAGIFDGHGGVHTALLAKEFFGEDFLANLKEPSTKDIPALLQEALNAIQENKKGEYLGRSGSTAVVSFIDKQRGIIYTATLGDSEVKLYRRNEEGGLNETPLSCVRDWASSKDAKRAVDYWKEKGKKDTVEDWLCENREVAKPYFPERGNGINVSRALGDKEWLNAVSHKAKITLYPLKPGDFVVMGCDGLWDVVTSEEMKTKISNLERSTNFPTNFPMELVKYALGPKNSSDNVTVIAIWIGEKERGAEPVTFTLET